jgi:hypothetical protein
MQIIRAGDTTSTNIEIQFTSVQTANVQNRILSTTLANTSITVWIKKAGTSSAVAGTGTWTACDDTNAPGVRGYKPSAADLTLGNATYVFTGTAMEPREIPVQVVGVDPFRAGYYGVLTGSPTTQIVRLDRSEATTGYWVDAMIRFTSGVCVGQVKKISAYNGATKDATLSTALSASPSAGDGYELVTA